MDSQISTRLAELEQAVTALQLRADTEDVRRRRVRNVRIVAFIALGAAYIFMVKQATSMLG